MLYEYEGKQLYKQYGLPIPEGAIIDLENYDRNQLRTLLERLGGKVIAKAQILGGKRKKQGLIKTIETTEELQEFITFLTHTSSQTTTHPQKIKYLYLESLINIEKEYYTSLLLDRVSHTILVMVSEEGGIEIEEVAAQNPEKIFKKNFPLRDSYFPYHFDELLRNLTLTPKQRREFSLILAKLITMLRDSDLLMVEVNPLVYTKEGTFSLLDSKIIIDENALYRHKDFHSFRSLTDAETEEEKIAKKYGLSYVQLEGDIGMISCGAGLSMATCDLINDMGGKPANFLDVGGGATPEKVSQALSILFSQPQIKGIFVNVFGGITRCDLVAKGIIDALEKHKEKLPLTVRLIGTNDEEGVKLLREHNIISYTEMVPAIKDLLEIMKSHTS